VLNRELFAEVCTEQHFWHTYFCAIHFPREWPVLCSPWITHTDIELETKKSQIGLEYLPSLN